LYRKLLLDFQANYGETAEEIRGALADRNYDQAHSLIHNLKGLAGNLEATDLQAAAKELENLVRGKAVDTIDDLDLDQKFKGLEAALGEALDAVRILGPAADKQTIESGSDTRAAVPDELKKKIAENIKEAAEMGDVMQIKIIADELKSESDAVGPICDEIIQLAEDFDFDGIQKFVMALED
jgi:HPt (histidine-containing phosphotransfer) domain-containing protein